MNEGQPVKKKKRVTLPAFAETRLFKVLISVFLFFSIGSSAVVLYYYNYYSKIIDRRLSGEVFKQTAKVYAAPYRIYPGQRITAEAVAARLQKAGFELGDKSVSDDGVYQVSGNKITIKPLTGSGMRLEFQKNSLGRIVKLPGDEISEAYLPPELVTNLYDESREKRRVVEFDELPKDLVNALIASEDRRFYSHFGIDPIRLVGAVVTSIRKSERVEGTSTITQQLARNFFLTLDRSAKRKITEAFIALMLEQRLTKKQILTMYANEIYLGNRGSFAIHGFGEGAAAYFGKGLGDLTLPEAATLVGIFPSPNAYSPSKYPDRAKNRRNIVLNAMRSMGTITADEFDKAKVAELKVTPIKPDATNAPYLVDYIRDELLKDYSEDALINDSLRVYTTLDPDMQRAAVEAVDKGLRNVEDQIAERNKRRKNPDNRPGPQAALIVLDPHTGDIKAMVGGSDYGASQYNRITQAFRQPGSIFKPLVYAAAFETAFDGQGPASSESVSPAEPATGATPALDLPPSAEAAAPVADPSADPAGNSQFNQFHPDGGYITALTTFVDEPTTFTYDNDRVYDPGNFKDEYRGVVTARTALQHSLNIPTIKVAERIGYGRVAEFARRAGLNGKIKGYPSIALGAFEVTPFEMAGAYTIFANAGKRMQPHALTRVASSDRSTTKAYNFEPQQVIRPELAYLMTHLMEGVIESGTAVRVRALGFTLPAAGKTGTSRDGWFAGYTKDLLAIAWVGYDDNRDLNLEGSRSALPIWTDFMLQAQKLSPPRDPDTLYFEKPSGIEFAQIDADSLQLAGPRCENTFSEAFIAGTAPTTYCPIHRLTISDAIENGVKETGQGIGNAVKGIGRFFGGLFGGGNDNKEQ